VAGNEKRREVRVEMKKSKNGKDKIVPHWLIS